MAELGGEPQATVIGARDAPAGGERRLRERDALPRARLRRHALGLGQPRLDRDRAGGARRRPSSARRERRRRARGDRRGQRGRVPRRHGRAGRVPRARLPPDGDLRDLRRRRRGRARGRARRRRSRRARSGSPARSRAGSSRTSPTGRRRSRCIPAWAAHGAHLAARLAAHGAAGPRSVLEGKFGLYHAFLGAEEGEIDIAGQLADLGSRWETPRIAYKPFPVCHFMHGSLGAAAEARGGAHVRARRDRGRPRHRARGGRLARARAGGREEAPALGVRGEVLAPVLGRLAARPRARRRRRLHRRGDRRPGGARGRREGALRDARLPDVPAGVPRRRPTCGSPTGRRSRPTTRIRRVAPRTRCRPTRCARSSARTRHSRSPTTRSSGSRRRCWRSTSRRRQRGAGAARAHGGRAGVSTARLRLAVAGETVFPPRAPFFSRAWGTSRFPTPLPAHRPKIGR